MSSTIENSIYRDLEASVLFFEKAMTVQEIAIIKNLSVPSIYRILKDQGVSNEHLLERRKIITKLECVEEYKTTRQRLKRENTYFLNRLNPSLCMKISRNFPSFREFLIFFKKMTRA